jgi:hypothetical protein
MAAGIAELRARGSPDHSAVLNGRFGQTAPFGVLTQIEVLEQAMRARAEWMTASG